MCEGAPGRFLPASIILLAGIQPRIFNSHTKAAWGGLDQFPFLGKSISFSHQIFPRAAEGFPQPGDHLHARIGCA
jgi:hypothetical protein